MSFSSDVKAELTRSDPKKKCCALAECYGILLYCSTFSAREIRIITASTDFAAALPKLFQRALMLRFDSVTEPASGGKSSFLITDKAKIDTVYRAFGMEARDTLQLHINLGVLENDCCKTSFVRGAFLAGGSVTDPEKGYHLELATSHESVSREMHALMLELNLSPRETVRGRSFVTYFKQSEAIADMLTGIGASVSAMEIMSAKIEKDMRNVINRKVNCDTANADKTVAAAQQQLTAIRLLEREDALDDLPEGLLQAALLRIANPEASLADLAQLSNPAVTKSCLSHRLRRLVELAAQQTGGK